MSTAHRPRIHRSRAAQAATPPSQPPVPADDAVEPSNRIAERPDGFHWTDEQGRQEFGPFETYEDALADMQGTDVTAIEHAEALEEAERDMGIETQIDAGGTDEPEGAT